MGKDSKDWTNAYARFGEYTCLYNVYQAVCVENYTPANIKSYQSDKKTLTVQIVQIDIHTTIWFTYKYCQPMEILTS